MSRAHQKFAAKTFAIGAGFLIFIVAPVSMYAAFTINKPIATNPNLSSGLVGHWTFDGSNLVQNATDSSGLGNHGRLRSFTSTTTTSGPLGQALTFDGIDDYIRVEDANSLDSTSEVTLSVWVKANSWTGEGGGIASLIKKDSNYLLRKDTVAGSGGTGVKILWWDGSNVRYVKANTPSVGVWHHIVGVASGNDASRVYVDGVSVGGAAGTLTALSRVLTNILEIGSGGFGAESFDGIIDDVRIYNRALSVDEVKRLYGLGATTHVGVSTQTGLSATTSASGASNGLVGWWTFDGSNMLQNVADKSGNGNHGRLISFPATSTAVVSGTVGQGLKFDGVDDYVTVGDVAAVDSATDLSGCAWVYHNTITTDDSIFAKDNAGVDGFRFFRDDVAVSARTDVYSIFIADSADTDSVRVESATGSSPLQKWTHVCFTFTLGSATGARLYVNGVEDANSPQSTASIGAINAGANVFTIGTVSGGSAFLDGALDDVRIYTRVLSLVEIKRIYGLGATTHVGVTPTTGLAATTTSSGGSNGLVGHWTFDGPNMLQNVADKSGNGNHGRLVSFPATSTAVVSGKIGQALKFDGLNDYVNTQSNSTLTGNPSFTISAWVYIPNPATITSLYPPIVGWGTEASLQTVYFGLEASNPASMFVGVNSNGQCGATKTNQWAHYVWTRAGGGGAQTGNTLYVNGTSVSLTNCLGTNGTPNIGTSPYKLGTNAGATRFANWMIDDVRIYNRVLSTQEVLRLYQTGQ
jgi:hypothetical protein